MSILELKEIIERFGVMVDRWPSDRLSDALDLLQTSPEAQDIFAAATIAEEAQFELLHRLAPAPKGMA